MLRVAVTPVGVAPITLLAGAISVGYLLFGGYLLTQYEGIGVRSLGGFALLWGASFCVSLAVVSVFAGYGFTDGGQLTQLGSVVPSSVQPLLISGDFLAGVLTVGGIFVWFWFVLQYTRRIGRRERVAMFALGGIALLVATLNGLVGAAAAFDFLSIRSEFRGNFHSFASVVEILTTSVAIGVGIALLYTTASRHRPFEHRTVVSLTLPILGPWLVGYLYQFSLVTGFQSLSALYAGTLAVGLLSLGTAVTNDGLFEQLPASRTVGRQTVFESSETAIVVVNNDGNVSDLNPAATALFDTASRDSIGESLATLLPSTVDSSELRQPEPTTFSLPNSDTVIEATTTTATDDNGQPIGQTIIFTDITTERRRQQRIQVLNRVLRHNLRNDLNAAKGYVDLLASEEADTERFQSKIESILDDLVTIGNKAQSTERVLAADPIANTPTRLSEIIDDSLDDIGAVDDTIEPVVSVPAEVSVRINPVVLHSVIAEAIENAVRHSGCSELTVDYNQEPPSLVIADNGSGIPDHEIAVLDNAQETDLEHGSGLGLWLIKWGTDSFGGSVTFETDNTGTSVRIDFPPALVETDA